MTKKKSFWSFVLAICLIIPTMIMFTACGKDKNKDGNNKENQEQQIEHTHTFSTDWSKDATHHWYAATCEHTNEKSGYVEHSFSAWTVTTEAGFGTTGSRERVCSVCEYKATETISALDAKTNEITVEEINFTYSGKSQAIDSLITASNKTGMVVEYEGTNGTTYAKSTTAPTNAGSYKYTITIPATAEWKEAQETGSFTIEKYSIKCPDIFVSYLRNGNTTTNVLQEIDLSGGTYGIESDEVVNLIFNNGESSNYGVGRMDILAKKIKIDNSNFTLTNVPTGNSATIEWIVADENDSFGFRVTEVEDAGSCYVGTIQHGCVEVGDKLTIIGTNTTGNLVKTNVTISSIEYWNTSDFSNQKYVKTNIATVRREGSSTESGKVKISFTKDDASAVLPSTVDYVVAMQDMGTINQHQKTQTTTELTFVGNEYRIFKLNIDTTNTIKLTSTNPDTCSVKVFNATTGEEITLENNKFTLSESADILIVVKQGTTTDSNSHKLTVESIEYTFGS